MEEDLIDSMFSNLEEFYPGSRHKRRESTPPPAPKAEVAWDSKSYKKTLPSGKDVEMFALGALADALGRPIITVRHWIKEGHVPPSPYRLPTKKNKNGEEHKGRRLYTRKMIEAAVQIFTEAGLMDSTRIDWVKHRLVAEKLNETWLSLRED
jgi:hypothetical protein